MTHFHVSKQLRRIADRQEAVCAWVALADEEILVSTQARSAVAPDATRPLTGLSVGIKDTIDVAGFVTGCGSQTHDTRPAFQNAALISELKAKGALIFGKTATAELAFQSAPKTRNPLNLDRSPGGSSSGSAAAVADGQVDVGFGTQTAGSIIRPASFCGVVGYKPTNGHFSMAGILSTAPSLDCVGWMAKDVSTVARIRHALLDEAPIDPTRKIAFGICRTAHWDSAATTMRDGVDDLALRLDAFEIADLPRDLDSLHALIMHYEMHRELAAERLSAFDLLSEPLRNFLSQTPARLQVYLAARHRVAEIDIDSFFGENDVLLTPAAVGEAVPFGSTGDPRFNRCWTLLGLPCVTLPMRLGENGLPLGIQLVARRNQDDVLLSAAAIVETVISSEKKI